MADPTWLNEFSNALMELDLDAVDFLGEEPEAEEIAEALVRIHTMKAELDLVFRTVSHALATKMDFKKELTVPGATIEKKVGSQRKGWDHPGLAHEVLRRRLQMSLDEETGEFTLTPGQAVEAVLECLQPSYWRVGKLGELGINADLYSEAGDTKESIVIRKAK